MIKNKYIDIIEQTFYFPRHGFDLHNDELTFYGIDLMYLIEKYGTPFKFTYLPKIDMQIQKAIGYFNDAIAKHKYQNTYKYCYCTKSSHFNFIIERALENGIGIETSSAFDLDIIKKLTENNKFKKEETIICNGYKPAIYLEKVVNLVNEGYTGLVSVLDYPDELQKYPKANFKIPIGIRMSTEEEPNSNFYTSRLGMNTKSIVDFYKNEIQNDEKFELKMLHFFVNTGIRDTAYYWSELARLINVYCDVKEVAPELEMLDIGGGMPIYTTLGIEYDYAYMIDQIVLYIKTICEDRNVPTPKIMTEFGSYTVGESGGSIYSTIGEKLQNDKERWYMIDSSFITTLPDTWGIGQKFILLAINHWKREHQRINLGGITCDGQDYYNSDTHTNQVFMPKINKDEKLYLGFFHTGAYQESIGGYGGTQHCLIPAPKHIVIDKNENGEFSYRLFAEEQKSEDMLKILGY